MDNRTLVTGDRTLVAPAGGDRTQAMTPPGLADRTQMGVALTCPVCSTQNAGGTEWCGECGFRLDAAPGSAPSPGLAGPLAALTDPHGKTYPLHRGVSTLGRQDTTILLNDPTISRRHAQITIDDEGVWVEDLGSSNGTKVEGYRIEPGVRVPVHSGMTLVLGGVTLSLEVLESAPVSSDLSPEEAGTADTTGGDVEDALQPQAVDSPPADESLSEAMGTESASAESGTISPRLLLPDGERYDLPEGVTTVGRRDTNDVTLPDSYVSGAHAELTRAGDSVTLTDRNSTNGTFLNGDRIPPGSPTPLNDGDRITFGQMEVTFAVASEPDGTGEHTN